MFSVPDRSTSWVSVNIYESLPFLIFFGFRFSSSWSSLMCYHMRGRRWIQNCLTWLQSLHFHNDMLLWGWDCFFSGCLGRLPEEGTSLSISWIFSTTVDAGARGRVEFSQCTTTSAATDGTLIGGPGTTGEGSLSANGTTTCDCVGFTSPMIHADMSYKHEVNWVLLTSWCHLDRSR